MEPLDDSPPRRPRDLLQTWLQDFKNHGHAIAGDIRVAPQEDTAERDTGLVIMTLANADASVYIEANGYDELLWSTTITGLSEDVTLSPHHLASLAAELVVAGNLCAYLQWRSLEWNRDTGITD